jgi:hypothetical protein
MSRAVPTYLTNLHPLEDLYRIHNEVGDMLREGAQCCAPCSSPLRTPFLPPWSFRPSSFPNPALCLGIDEYVKCGLSARAPRILLQKTKRITAGRAGLKGLNYLLDNWENETTKCNFAQLDRALLAKDRKEELLEALPPLAPDTLHTHRYRHTRTPSTPYTLHPVSNTPTLHPTLRAKEPYITRERALHYARKSPTTQGPHAHVTPCGDGRPPQPTHCLTKTTST